MKIGKTVLEKAKMWRPMLSAGRATSPDTSHTLRPWHDVSQIWDRIPKTPGSPGSDWDTTDTQQEKVLPTSLSEEKHCYCATIENSFLKDILTD